MPCNTAPRPDAPREDPTRKDASRNGASRDGASRRSCSRLLARLLASVASLALVTGAGLVPALGQTVGTAAAVNPRSTGAGASGTRVLELGASIIHRERIETSSSGSVQVLFVDKTTLNIGPGSNLVIDEFVYDPNAKAGSMAISLSKGAARFVGGNASHSGGAEITTPVATIGIRGGVTAVTHRNGETRAILQFGTLTAQDRKGQQVVVRRPGFMVTVGRDGITGPVRVSQAEIDAVIAETRSRPGQKGGRSGPVADLGGQEAGASHPCAAPAQGQTTLDLAAATCRYVNTELQGEADVIAQQASQQNQRFEEHYIPPPYGYGGGPVSYGGGYSGGISLPSLPGLPGYPGSYASAAVPSLPTGGLGLLGSLLGRSGRD